MDLREELLKAVAERDEEGVKVASVEALRKLLDRHDRERAEFSQAMAAYVFVGEQP